MQYVTLMLHIFHFSSACSSIKGLVGARGGICLAAGVHVKGILAYKTSSFKFFDNQKSRCLKSNAIPLNTVRPLPVLITILGEHVSVHQERFMQASNPPNSRTYPNEVPKGSQQHSTPASQVQSTPPGNPAAHPPRATLPRRARGCAVA